MQRRLALAILLSLGVALPLGGADSDAARAIVEKAIKAMGGADKLDKYPAGRTTTRGTLELGASVPFTQEIITKYPNQFRETLNLEIKDKKVTVVTVFDGEKGWLSVNGQVKDADGKVLEELREAAYMMKAGRLTRVLDDKDLTISQLGETRVEGSDAVGLKIASRGHRDYNIYFDKKSGLPVRIERRVHDFMSNQDVNEDRIIKEYMEVDGVKVPKKAVLLRDGKQFMTVEVQGVKFLDSVDKSEFAKP